MKTKTLLLAICLAFNAVYAAETPDNLQKIPQIYTKKMPTLAEVRAQKVYGAVTILIPLAVLLIPHYIFYKPSFLEEGKLGCERYDEADSLADHLNLTTAVRGLITASVLVATALTSLIPFHFFNKAAEKTERRQQVIHENSLSQAVKDLIKRHLPA